MGSVLLPPSKQSHPHRGIPRLFIYIYMCVARNGRVKRGGKRYDSAPYKGRQYIFGAVVANKSLLEL